MYATYSSDASRVDVRRPHKKSRGGCNQCKARRVKCDEQGDPEKGDPCFNCVARDTACQYSDRARLAQRRRQREEQSTKLRSSLSQEPTTPKESPDAVDYQGARRALELELMNHWTAHTYLTFCHRAGQPDEHDERIFWRDIAPREALTYEHSLTSLLALSSLHLAALIEPSQKDRYLTAAIDYHNKSLQLFMEALPHITQDNCHIIYQTSLAHFALGTALSQIAPLYQDHESIRDSVLSNLALFSGSQKILRLYEQQLSTKPVAMATASKSMQPYLKVDRDFLREIDCLRAINDARYRNIAPQRHHMNNLGLQELQHCSTRLANNIHAAVVGWLMSLEENFVIALQEREPVATLALMHWAVLLERPTNLWWFLKSGRPLVMELSSSLSDLSEQEHAARDWCHRNVLADR